MTMHIKTIASGLALALLSTTAFAADLPSRRAPPVYAPPPPIPVFTWTGFYVGAQVGYEFGRSSGTLFTNTPVAAVVGGAVAVVPAGFGLAANGASKNGVIGGGHVGYLFSTQSLPVIGSFFGGNGAFGLGTAGVVGIEGDVDGSSARSTYFLGGFSDNTRENIQGSIRGRLGIAFDRALFYATGGAAFGSFQNTYVNTFNGTFDSYSRTRVGYTVGGGVEYAFTNNLSARVEYRFSDYGRYTNVLNASAGGVLAVSQRETDNRVQAGLSYKFDTFTPAPVVARY